MSDAALKIDHFASTMLPSAVPESDARAALPDATGGSVMDWSNMLDRYNRVAKNYPIWSVTLNGKPLEVTVCKEGQHWSAENKEYNVLGQGESVSEALKDALDGIRYLSNELLDEPDEILTDYAKALKQRYSKLLIAY